MHNDCMSQVSIVAYKSSWSSVALYLSLTGSSDLLCPDANTRPATVPLHVGRSPSDRCHYRVLHSVICGCRLPDLLNSDEKRGMHMVDLESLTSTAPAGDQCRCALRRPEFLAVSRASLVRQPDTAATCRPSTSFKIIPYLSREDGDGPLRYSPAAAVA